MHSTHHHAARGITLGDLIDWGGGVSQLPAAARHRRFASVWNDSRSVKPGDVFIALKTDKDDGHRYVAAALAAGAAAAIVDRKASFECSAADRKKLIAVVDPLHAVQRIASRYRRELGILLIGVTGSNGKTTTRRFIAAVLGAQYPLGETWSNWNNHIGVPLSLLRFTGEEWAGVLEFGANHGGEISALSKVARPDIGVITNIGYAHVGLFGSLAATTRSKFEILDGLNKNGGFLLVNGDDERIVAYAKRLDAEVMYFGTSPRCAIRPDSVRFDATHGLDLMVGGAAFHLPVPGRFYMYSALPAIFLGRRCGVPDSLIAVALAAQKPLSLRGAVEKNGEIRFIVDCYNANPSSMKSAIEGLCGMAPKGKRMAVVGDMLELGRYSVRLHHELGALLAESGVKKVVAVGAYAAAVLDGAVKAGMPARRLVASPTAEAAIPVVRKLAAPGDVVLLKGSRGVHLETVFESF